MQPRRRSAFTLVELLVALGVFGLLSAGLMTFYIQALRAANQTQQKTRLVADMRSITNEMLFNASRAHEMIIYDSWAASDRNEATDRREITDSDEDGELEFPTGNFVVFVYYELPKPSDEPRYRIERLIGYALDRSGSDPGRFTRVTIELNEPSTDTVEEVLTDNWTAAERKTYTRLVMPLALAKDADEDDTPRLFYKRSEQNLAICGQLLMSLPGGDTRDRHTLTRTMFFTVTTRS